jgi:hypothetical protein
MAAALVFSTPLALNRHFITPGNILNEHDKLLHKLL